MRPYNIFVLGLDDFHRTHLSTVRDAENMRFIGIIDIEDVTFAKSYDMDELIDRAEAEIRAHGGPVDAIVGYYDFPVSTMLPILRRRLSRKSGPSLESVLRCEHKYWSRCEQREVIPDLIPSFELVDPFEPDAAEQIELDFPFWLKPVKALSSFLGFRIENDDELRHALTVTRERIDRMASPFDQILARADLPPHIARATGSHCVAESLIGGYQCTLEGYVFDGECHVYGVVDSICYPNGSSFSRYQYPSALPEEVQQRMTDAIARVLAHVQFDDSPFNAEFYWDEATDRIWLLEINTRLSQSHAFQFMSVHGRAHQEVMIDCALGRRPQFEGSKGPYAVAAKFMVREEDDGIIVHAPSAEDLSRIEDEIPGTRLLCLVEEGTRLSDLQDQDSYLYEVAHIYCAAHTEAEMLDKYRRCLRRMDLQVLPDEPRLGGRLHQPKIVFPPIHGSSADRSYS